AGASFELVEPGDSLVERCGAEKDGDRIGLSLLVKSPQTLAEESLGGPEVASDDVDLLSNPFPLELEALSPVAKAGQLAPPPPVRPSNRIFRLLAACGRRRQAQAFTLCIATLCAAASANATPGTVASKQAQAQQVLAQIQQIDDSLGPAIESYNLANVQLKK